MTLASQKKRNDLFTVVFFLSNILNTFFLTNGVLNRYIAPFPHTLEGELNAILGNVAVLLVFFAITCFLLINQRRRMKALILITVVFNVLFYLFSIFNMYYGALFTVDQFSMFRNPSGGFVLGVIGVGLLELIVYWRIVLFIPTISLVWIYLKSDKEIISDMYHPRRPKRVLIVIMTTVLMIFSSVTTFLDMYSKTLPIGAVKSMFAIQNLGVYPYYAAEFLGFDPKIDIEGYLGIADDQDLLEAFDSYNKNQTAYINFLDGQTYSNRLTMTDTFTGLTVSPALLAGESLQGIFKDKNLVLIHMESFNAFLMELPETRAHLPFLETLLSESVVMTNYYTNVGMGVSSDAELSVLTGLCPTGHQTIYWEYEHDEYELSSLPDYFSGTGYQTKVVHGDTGLFYNRESVYTGMIPFDDYYSLEDFVEDGYVIKDGYTYDHDEGLVHHSPWISDYHLAETIFDFGQTMNEPFFMFPIMMMPHTPYEYDPNGERTGLYPMWDDQISTLTKRYVNYLDYYDDVMIRLFIGEDGSDHVLDDTVYIFYSDHGSGIKNGDLDALYDQTLSGLETRKILQHTLAFIYAPGENRIEKNGYQIREGLIKGEQNLLRSHVDLFRTIVETFDLSIGSNPYFGVNLFSTEPTFAIENRPMDVVTDDLFFSMIKPKDSMTAAIVEETLLDQIIRFKVLSDLLLSTTDYQQRLNRAYARRSDES